LKETYAYLARQWLELAGMARSTADLSQKVSAQRRELSSNRENRLLD
jgi:hypothetical protein